MINKHLLLSLRSLKNKLLYTLLVTLGLAVGAFTFMGTLQWSAWHFSFDRHVPQKDQIFRLTFEENNEDFFRHTARILHGSALNRIIFSDMLGEVESSCRIAPYRNAILRVGENSHNESLAFACDTSFFTLFVPEVLHGPSSELLQSAHTMVLTESAARKYFGKEDPVGRGVELMHQFDTKSTTYTVEAVIADCPPNSHMRYSLLTSFEDPLGYEGTAWTYLKLQKGQDPGILETRLKTFLDNNLNEPYVAFLQPRLQALAHIHLRSDKAREMKANVPLRGVLIVLVAGFLVFVLAWFNFTLLSFSRNHMNIHRMIIQWQMGATKAIFYRQFLWEHLLTGLLSLLVGLGGLLALAPSIHRLGGMPLGNSGNSLLLSLGTLLLFIALSALLTSFISTQRLYLHLQQKHLSSSRRSHSASTRKSFLIKGVILLEFIITFILISNLLLINRQTQFAMSAQLGSGMPESIQLQSLHRPVVDKFPLFRERMLESPSIAMVTASMEEPTGEAMDANTFELNGIDEGDKRLFLFPVDEHFFDFYGLEVLYGRGMPALYNPEDTLEYFYLNETAARMLSGDPASLVGQALKLNFPYPDLIWPGTVEGVVEDFHLSGMNVEISPMVVFPKYTWLLCFSILPSGSHSEALAHLEKVWEELFPEFPLEYQFASDMVAKLYSSELQQMRILLVFSLLSLLISGMGLFALSGLFMQRRVKSAALRKINGASLPQVILPEFRYYFWLVLLGSALSIGPSLFMMERWMRNFHYRVDHPLWIFPLCVVILLIFSWLAILYHSFRLARINPIEFIRES